MLVADEEVDFPLDVEEWIELVVLITVVVERIDDTVLLTEEVDAGSVEVGVAVTVEDGAALAASP